MKAVFTASIVAVALSLTACEQSSSNDAAASTAASVPAPSASASVASASQADVAKYALFERAQGGACQIEKFDKQGSQFDVGGWAVIDATHGVVPEEVLVTVVDGGKEDMHIASRSERDDVAVRFNAPGLKASSGFSAQIDDQALKAGDQVVIYLAFQNHLYSCASRAV